MSVDAYDIIELKHDGDGSFSQDFLAENCRQCRNDEGGYDHENCVDEVAALASDFAYLQNEDDNLYRTMDDKKCWNKETYDTWLKKRMTNPVTRQKLKIPVDTSDSEERDMEDFENLLVGPDRITYETDHMISDHFRKITQSRNADEKDIHIASLKEFLLRNVHKFLPFRFKLWSGLDMDSREEAKLLFNATWDIDGNDKGEYSSEVLYDMVFGVVWKEGAEKYYNYYRVHGYLTADQQVSAESIMEFFSD